ncbi:hypothetical protein DL98DRAFT_518976 [Cadophora sp. DSE1049]|nr:hypothetical protein DL98DRAFT_518976 [Cadophora sp. DSE1049]
MPDIVTSWNYWNCCKCHRNIIPVDVGTCPNPGCKEKRCVQCPEDGLIVPVLIESSSLQSLFTQPVEPEVPWWNCCKCYSKCIPKDDDACPDCKEKRCADCPVEKTQRRIPRPTE